MEVDNKPTALSPKAQDSVRNQSVLLGIEGFDITNVEDSYFIDLDYSIDSVEGSTNFTASPDAFTWTSSSPSGLFKSSWHNQYGRRHTWLLSQGD